MPRYGDITGFDDAEVINENARQDIDDSRNIPCTIHNCNSDNLHDERVAIRRADTLRCWKWLVGNSKHNAYNSSQD